MNDSTYKYRHSGCGFPNDRVDNARVFALPSPDLLMLSTEGRYHHDAAVAAGKRVLWRSIPRIGKRPAELGWSPARFVAETINLTDAPSQPIRDFVWANELDLNSERGDNADDFQGLDQRYNLIGGWAYSVVQSLRQWSPETRIHWPAWTPDHHALDFLWRWRDAASLCHVVDFHGYDSLANIERQYTAYRQAFPDKPLALTEWHCKGDIEEERRTLQWLAEAMDTDPLFEAAYFFIWRWWDHPGWWSDAWDIEHSPDRLALFLDPPTVTRVPDPPGEPETPTMPPDPWQFFTPEQIAAATGCPQAAIVEHWPRLVEQLGHCGITDKSVQMAMISTVAIETASRFEPIHEFRNADGSIPSYWYGYDGGPDFHGRGFIQITHRSNYATYGPKVAELWGTSPDQPDFDLVGEPDRALDPDISAAVAALYFRDHRRDDGYGIPDAARDGDWREVRRLVQGGSAGLDRLVQIVAALGGSVPATEERTYGPNVPDDVILQRNAWSCAVRSTYAALWAMNQQGQGQAVTYGDEGAADVYEWLVPAYDRPDVGLLDHTGAGLAEALRKRGYPAANYYPVSLDAVRDVAGRMPVLLGGDAWNHWVYVRGKTADNGLILENPSPGHMGIEDYLRDSFGRLGPMAMVVIDGPQVQTPGVDYASLVGVAYHDDGTVIPALEGARASGDWSQVEAVVRFLRENNPHKAA